MVACIPPFEPIFVLLVSAAVVIFIAVRNGEKSADPAAPATPPGLTARDIVRLALFVMLIAALFWGLLALGYVIGIWGV